VCVWVWVCGCRTDSFDRQYRVGKMLRGKLLLDSVSGAVGGEGVGTVSQ
jgi:hypothetical protein